MVVISDLVSDSTVEQDSPWFPCPICLKEFSRGK